MKHSLVIFLYFTMMSLLYAAQDGNETIVSSGIDGNGTAHARAVVTAEDTNGTHARSTDGNHSVSTTHDVNATALLHEAVAVPDANATAPVPGTMSTEETNATAEVPVIAIAQEANLTSEGSASEPVPDINGTVAAIVQEVFQEDANGSSRLQTIAGEITRFMFDESNLTTGQFGALLKESDDFRTSIALLATRIKANGVVGAVLSGEQRHRKVLEDKIAAFRGGDDPLFDDLLQQAAAALRTFRYGEFHRVLASYEARESIRSVLMNVAQLRFLKAQEYYDRALDREAEKDIGKALVLDSNNSSYVNLYGLVLNYLGQHDRAAQQFETVLSMEKQRFDSDDLSVADAHNNLGAVWYSKGDYNRSIESIEKALSIHMNRLGADHPDVAGDYNRLGAAFYGKGAYEQAIAHYEKALEIDKKHVSGEHSILAKDYNNLAMAYAKQGNHDRAIEYFQQTLEIDRKRYIGKHPNLAVRYSNLGSVWRSKGDYDKAIEYFEMALNVDKSCYPAGHLERAKAYNRLGMAWDGKGEYDTAIAHYEKALAILSNTLGDGHPHTKIVKENLERSLSKKVAQ